MGYQYPVEGAEADGRVCDTVYALAAGNKDATERGVLLFNLGGETTLTAPDGVWTLHVLDGEHDLTPVGTVRSGETVTLPAEGAVLLTMQVGE